jgi:SRSO17 transposase
VEDRFMRRIDMDVQQIKEIGPQLERFLREFDDCFGRSEPREHLRTYVQGQLSNLPRKSVEPMALSAGVAPRTLQGFLSYLSWDEPHLRDRQQWIVARDHSHPKAIGVIDESGNSKKGGHTACVQRQWCGNTGKTDNCVVAVHLSYVAGDFQCLLDSDLFVPESWANDPVRRQEVGIPEEVVFRTKPQIALAQIARCLANGIRVHAWTFDELYGRGREFLDGFSALGQNFVGEIPSDFTGWLQAPRVLRHPSPQERHKRGRKRRYPRLSRKALPACEVRNLATYSPVFRKQKWQRFRIKDGEKGPVVWEVKHAPFYRKQGPHGLPGPAQTLIVARNVLVPGEIKYFLSNLRIDGWSITLEWLLWVAFSRWPIERCFEIAKRELGMDHFEMRSWRGIHRHLYLTQVSQLFCARVHQQLREKKRSPESVPDRRTGSPGGLCLGAGPSVSAVRPDRRVRTGGRVYPVLSAEKSTGTSIPLEDNPAKTQNAGDRCSQTEVLYTR